jgi:hypothetical protein
MKNILLSPPGDRWHKIVPLSTEEPELFRSFTRGIQFLKLRPETPRTDVRRVNAFLNDTMVGELAADDARYFLSEITRMNNHGMELFLECKVSSSHRGRTIMYRHVNRTGLVNWVDSQIRQAAHHETEISS